MTTQKGDTPLAAIAAIVPMTSGDPVPENQQSYHFGESGRQELAAGTQHVFLFCLALSILLSIKLMYRKRRNRGPLKTNKEGQLLPPDQVKVRSIRLLRGKQRQSAHPRD